MLKKINAGKVESDTGFSVHITGLETLKYQENGRYIILDWALNPKSQTMTIYLQDVANWSSEAHQTISPEKKASIKRNIEQAVALLDGDFEVV